MFKTDFEARKAPKMVPKMVPKPIQNVLRSHVILNRAKIDFKQTLHHFSSFFTFGGRPKCIQKAFEKRSQNNLYFKRLSRAKNVQLGSQNGTIFGFKMDSKSVSERIKKVYKNRVVHRVPSRRLQEPIPCRGPADPRPGEGGWGKGRRGNEVGTKSLDHLQPRGLVGFRPQNGHETDFYQAKRRIDDTDLHRKCTRIQPE